MIEKLKKLTNNQHFKYGFPFVIFIVGVPYLLKFFAQFRIDSLKDKQMITKGKELQGLIGSKQLTIEEVYEDYTREVDINGWKNIRGPRPWEKDNEDYKKMIERRAEESKQGWVFSK